MSKLGIALISKLPFVKEGSEIRKQGDDLFIVEVLPSQIDRIGDIFLGCINPRRDFSMAPEYCYSMLTEGYLTTSPVHIGVVTNCSSFGDVDIGEALIGLLIDGETRLRAYYMACYYLAIQEGQLEFNFSGDDELFTKISQIYEYLSFDPDRYYDFRDNAIQYDGRSDLPLFNMVAYVYCINNPSEVLTRMLKQNTAAPFKPSEVRDAVYRLLEQDNTLTVAQISKVLSVPVKKAKELMAQSKGLHSCAGLSEDKLVLVHKFMVLWYGEVYYKDSNLLYLQESVIELGKSKNPIHTINFETMVGVRGKRISEEDILDEYAEYIPEGSIIRATKVPTLTSIRQDPINRIPKNTEAVVGAPVIKESSESTKTSLMEAKKSPHFLDVVEDRLLHLCQDLFKWSNTYGVILAPYNDGSMYEMEQKNRFPSRAVFYGQSTDDLLRGEFHFNSSWLDGRSLLVESDEGLEMIARRATTELVVLCTGIKIIVSLIPKYAGAVYSNPVAVMIKELGK